MIKLLSEHGQYQQQGQGADHPRRRDGHEYPVQDDGREHDRRLIQQAHGVHADQTGGQQLRRRDGHGQQQLVVLGAVEAGIGVEHAAEYAQEQGDQAHQGEIQPVQAQGQQGHGQTEGHDAEYQAQKQHDEHEQDEHADDPAAAAGLAGLPVLEIGLEQLPELLFYEGFQHIISPPAPGRRTPGSCRPGHPPSCPSGSAGRRG